MRHGGREEVQEGLGRRLPRGLSEASSRQRRRVMFKKIADGFAASTPTIIEWGTTSSRTLSKPSTWRVSGIRILMNSLGAVASVASVIVRPRQRQDASDDKPASETMRFREGCPTAWTRSRIYARYRRHEEPQPQGQIEPVRDTDEATPGDWKEGGGHFPVRRPGRQARRRYGSPAGPCAPLTVNVKTSFFNVPPGVTGTTKVEVDGRNRNTFDSVNMGMPLAVPT